MSKLRCRKMGESCLKMMERCTKDHKTESMEDPENIEEMQSQEPSEERSIEMMTEAALRCTECGPKIEKKMLTDFEGECGGQWVKEDYEISLVGKDIL